MRTWLKRLRGALGFGVLGAVGFNLIGWLIVGGEALLAGALPSLTEVIRMTMFTLPVGGFVGVLSAGAISVGARWLPSITKGRAFLLGFPVGAVGGLLLSMTVAGLPAAAILVNAVAFGLGTGTLGATAIAIGEAAQDPPMLESDGRPPELAG